MTETRENIHCPDGQQWEEIQAPHEWQCSDCGECTNGFSLPPHAVTGIIIVAVVLIGLAVNTIILALKRRKSKDS